MISFLILLLGSVYALRIAFRMSNKTLALTLEEQIHFVDDVILGIHSGNSHRQVLIDLEIQSEGRKKLFAANCLRILSGKGSQEGSAFLFELLNCFSVRVRMAEDLHLLRKQLELQFHFQRKRKILLYQSRIQGSILFLLWIFLFGMQLFLVTNAKLCFDPCDFIFAHDAWDFDPVSNGGAVQMEALADPLFIAQEVRKHLVRGNSIRQVMMVLQEHPKRRDVQILAKWLLVSEPRPSLPKSWKRNSYRRALVNLLVRGIQGVSILENLTRIQDALIEESRNEIEQALGALPFQALIPLLFLQFPALLLLIFGPILLLLRSQL